jgi:hypothetical protein
VYLKSDESRKVRKGFCYRAGLILSCKHRKTIWMEMLIEWIDKERASHGTGAGQLGWIRSISVGEDSLHRGAQTDEGGHWIYELGLPTGGNFGKPKRNQTQIPFSLNTLWAPSSSSALSLVPTASLPIWASSRLNERKGVHDKLHHLSPRPWNMREESTTD